MVYILYLGFDFRGGKNRYKVGTAGVKICLFSFTSYHPIFYSMSPSHNLVFIILMS